MTGRPPRNRPQASVLISTARKRQTGAPRCAVVAGTVRDAEGRPIAGATVRLFRDSGELFFAGPARTDAQGHFRLEGDLKGPTDQEPLDSVPAHLLGRIESGVDAVEASVPIMAIFALEGSRPPVGTADLVIEDPAVWPSSPSGRIVFVHNSDRGTALYLINADGSDLALLPGTSTQDFTPVWTPDGRAVLFSRFGKLLLIDPDGGNLRPFGNDLIGFQLRWAPDGRHLAFLGDYTDDSGGRHLGAWITEPDGSDPQHLPTQDDQLCLRQCSSIGAFEWYPDSDRLGYYVSTPGTGGYREAGTYTTRLSDSTIEPIGGPVPVWADDGSIAALSRGSLIEIMDPNGTRLAAFPGGGRLAWSPDGEWLAYAAFELEMDPSGLWIADKSGGRRRRIALEAGEPDWQPTSAAPSRRGF